MSRTIRTDHLSTRFWVLNMFIYRFLSIRRIAWILLAVALAICLVTFLSRVADPNIAFGNENLTLTLATNRYHSRTIPISSDSPFSRKAHEVFDYYHGKWQRSYASYAPVIYVSSDSFNINFQPSRVIVNFANLSGSWTQVETEITTEEYFELERIAFEVVK